MRARDRARRLDTDYQPKLWLILGALVLLAAYAIYFVVSNDGDVSVDFLFAEATTSLIWVILLALTLGILVGVLLSQLYRRRSARSATPSEIRSGDS